MYMIIEISLLISKCGYLCMHGVLRVEEGGEKSDRKQTPRAFPPMQIMLVMMTYGLQKEKRQKKKGNINNDTKPKKRGKVVRNWRKDAFRPAPFRLQSPLVSARLPHPQKHSESVCE